MIFNAKDRPEKIFDFPIVKQIKYLGLLIDDKRNCFDSQKKRIDNNAHKYLSQMFSILGNCCNRMLIGKTFWKGLALTNLLYGADVINFTKTELDNLQIKDTKAYRIILRTSLGREAANAEAVYTQACISERRVGEAGGPKRAKRARANSRRESRVGEAGGHQPVWVRVSFAL